MCLIVFAWQTDPGYRLVLAANRDEFFARPSAPAGYWDEQPDVVGGRDLEKGGSWLAVDRAGRWAAVTNFRDGARPAQSARSRGFLVSEYVMSMAAPEAYAGALEASRNAYGGFSLLIANSENIYCVSNRGAGAKTVVDPGIHGLSNDLLDAPWPKVRHATAQLDALLVNPGGDLVEGLFELLLDRRHAVDQDLPSTGVGKQWERVLSPVFVSAGDYGTRASTVLLIGNDGSAFLEERGFDCDATEIHRRQFRFVTVRDALTARG